MSTLAALTLAAATAAAPANLAPDFPLQINILQSFKSRAHSCKLRIAIQVWGGKSILRLDPGVQFGAAQVLHPAIWVGHRHAVEDVRLRPRARGWVARGTTDD